MKQPRFLIALSTVAVALLAVWVFRTARQPAQPVDAATADALWVHDADAAFARAADEGEPVLIDFYADWCMPCKQMEETTFRDPRVIERLGGVVALKVDVDEQGALAQRFGITALPTTVVATHAGEPLIVEVGFLDAERFLALLPPS